MNVDKALANFRISSELRKSGDTGRRRVEHRSFLLLRFTHNIDTGHLGSDPNAKEGFHVFTETSNETLCISQKTP
jgi:hypothetical protein